MKDIWRKKYRNIAEKPSIEGFQVLTAFNANIDRTINLENLDWNLSETEDLEEVKSLDEVKKVLNYAIENEENIEVEASKLSHNFESGTQDIGGQAAIMANFLANMNGSVTFYTPLLSDELADMMDEKILHPHFDKDFTLKNVRDVSNTDRTKENVVIEFSENKTGRLILSDKLRGFGPYFRSGIEENLDLIDNNVQGALLSGFQNIHGNKKPKIEKAKKQLNKIESRVHIELADTETENLRLIGSHILPEADSIGLDESEALEIAEIIGEDVSDSLSIEESFNLFTTLIEEVGLSRCHLHTYRYHLTVTKKDYSVDVEDVRDGMLFGELAAIKRADSGDIPTFEDFNGLDFDNIHVKKLDELEKFEQFIESEDFAETGLAELENYKVVAIPTLIHEDPERLVGMGDLISSGAFAYELSTEI